MPTRKQRRRAAKEKRHEYEFVYVDSEGHELEEAPEEPAPVREERRNGKAPAAKAAQKGKPQAQRGGRPVRAPQPPSWQRAGKRALLLGAVVFALFYLTGRQGNNRLFAAIELAAVYTVLFVPFTYAIDRFAYQRWQRREQGGGAKKPPTKR